MTILCYSVPLFWVISSSLGGRRYKSFKGFLDSSLGKEFACNAGDPGLIPRLGRSAGEGIVYPLQYFLCFPHGSAGRESAHNMEDLGLIPGLGRFPWRREQLPTPVFWPGEFMDCIVHGITNSQTRLGHFDFPSLLLLSVEFFLDVRHCDLSNLTHLMFVTP